MRFGDWLGSRIRLSRKAALGVWKYGLGWRDKTRTGRVYSRVEYLEYERSGDVNEGTFREQPAHWRMRAEPGWAWTCQNCKEFSLITPSMLAAILTQWDIESDKIRAKGYKPGKRPSIEMVRCTNCHFRPGAPE